MKILVVDDESISRKILIKKMDRIGECTGMNDSLKALAAYDHAIKDNTPFDLITLDISMPKMDGRQLLSMIRKKEKALNKAREDRVKIIMVTSRMNMSTIKDCIRLGCDGYLSKPVNTYQLLGALGKMGLVPGDAALKEEEPSQTRMVKEIIHRFYKEKIKLPILPAIVNQIQKLMKAPDPSIHDLANIIRKDVIISSKLISIANSPLYKGVDKVDSLSAALVRLGMKATYGLVSTLITKDLFKSDNPVLTTLLEKLWSHSFACACLAKQIALELKLENSETVFLMGIVHDIGKMLLMKAIIEINPDVNLADEGLQLAVHEIHTTFGAALLKKMRFSKEFIQISEFHHWNDFSPKDEKELLVIHLSDYLVNHFGFGCCMMDEHASEKAAPDLLADIKNLVSLKRLNLDVEKVLTLMDEIKITIGKSAKAF